MCCHRKEPNISLACNCFRVRKVCCTHPLIWRSVSFAAVSYFSREYPCGYCLVGIHGLVLWVRLLRPSTRAMHEAVQIPRCSEEDRAETPCLLARYPGPINTSRAPRAAIGQARSQTENPDWAL
ncbi:hypothetical protein ASPSYDRAFT_411355 [Aspergillus sydowii CBS 593.65]|uniref:Uncharacterized protein n=1 Tax=Aspergillus sydowii CBS 593.65 TaxID=1036612 RepID=A0A1L9T7P1_9EURO|nr:uncharacterized protein ASPSYDRAFT_411355 [Aspergillus sydowii CBS 593.65]OJJ55460.1 hypothetical protein ASPSYDRAFT_411355 [Aspergillus sydowii CBS 593.65]